MSRDDSENPSGRPSAWTRDYEAVVSALAGFFEDGLEPLDEARYAEAPAQGDADDDEYHLARQWPLYLLADDRVSLLKLPPRLVARLRRLSDSRLATLVLRAVEEFVERHEAEMPAPVAGSAPVNIPLWRAEEVKDAVPVAEVVAKAQELARSVLKSGAR